MCCDIDFSGFASSDSSSRQKHKSRVSRAPRDIAASIITPLHAGIPERADHSMGLILNEDLHISINTNNESHANEAARQRITL